MLDRLVSERQSDPMVGAIAMRILRLHRAGQVEEARSEYEQARWNYGESAAAAIREAVGEVLLWNMEKGE